MWNSNKPAPIKLRHLKYVSSLTSTFDKAFRRTMEKALRPCIKTIKNVKVSSTHSIKTIILLNRYLSDLKSFSLELRDIEAIESLRNLRKTETLKISFRTADREVNKICEEENYFKRIAMKKLIFEAPKVTPEEIMKIAKLIPKSARLHFELEELSPGIGLKSFKDKLTRKIHGIRLKQPSNNSVDWLAQNTGSLMENLTHLHLGKEESIKKYELNQETNYTLFSKLGELKGLKSLKLNLKLTFRFAIVDEAMQFFKLFTLPVGLETLSLRLEGIVMKGRAAMKSDDFGWIFEQLGNLKELKALKLYFYVNTFCPKFWKDFVSQFPKGLPKLEILDAEVRMLNSETFIKPEGVFEWAHSHPMLRSVRLDIPFPDVFQEIFIEKIRCLERFSVSVAHLKTELKSIKFLANMEGLKYLNLKILKSNDFGKTLEIVNKYLSAIENLKGMKLKFVEAPSLWLYYSQPRSKKGRIFSVGINSWN